MKLGLAGKTALVLGASKGLGAAIAISLANEGAHVIGAARSVVAIEALAARVDKTNGGQIEAHALDLAVPASVAALADAMVARGGVDILINNSGGPAPGEARAASLEAWQSGFDAMIVSIIDLTQRLLPTMVERNWGRIVTLTSSGVDAPIPRLAVSNGLRLVLVGWSKTLASEVAANGVTVNVVVQGRIHTDRIRRGNSQGLDGHHSCGALRPAGRTG
jgi:3-oxoacyl-[acyl-carrier protein] reductase